MRVSLGGEVFERGVKVIHASNLALMRENHEGHEAGDLHLPVEWQLQKREPPPLR
jgi:hypothetical protein